eukprot:GEZU01005500.1.p1 GENE.GEZU01005500.1~~GEZU01005500.1.p1  ORF type:complete len:868 (-),score=490.90 GEZU01005500.1:2466-4721(-)
MLEALQKEGAVIIPAMEPKKPSKPTRKEKKQKYQKETKVEETKKEEKQPEQEQKEEEAKKQAEKEEKEESWEDLLDSSEDEEEAKKKEEEEAKKKKAEEERKKQEEEAKKKEEEEAKKKAEAEAAAKKQEADKKAAKAKDAKKDAKAPAAPEAKKDEKDLRSPICCILGHVDTGKTKLLDKIRHTNVQAGEAGGITQQIGATYFPIDTLREQTAALNEKLNLAIKVPGLLIIDTPGHESFTNLRSRGSGLCDIAILVVDIVHGLEPQTIESINLLKMRKTPFVVALNKVDRLFDWKTCPNEPIQKALKQQKDFVLKEFDDRVKRTITAFAEQGLNAKLYYQNTDFRKYVSLVPTSAISGEGIPDLLMLMVQLTQKFMEDRLLYLSELQCTILEVKVVEGLGTTIDVILSNGVLHEGDTIVVCGLNGPIVTTIRALLTPQPLREIRVKSDYVHHKEIKAAMGIKIVAQDLEGAVAGSSLLVAKPGDNIEDLKDEVMADLQNLLSQVSKTGRGVCVQASTLGSLEALLSFLNDSKIPVSGIAIGPVHLKDVKRASVMLESNPEYATILAFDVPVAKEARELADEMGVKIFTADIIYHLFDQFTAYMNKLKEERKATAAQDAVFPCLLKIIPHYVFNKRDPIICGVDVLEGSLRVGTPLCVPSQGNLEIGRVASIERDHKEVPFAKKGESVAIKIVPKANDQPKMYGRHFDHNDQLASKITRRSIDVLKEFFKDELKNEDLALIVKMKKWYNIQ